MEQRRAHEMGYATAREGEILQGIMSRLAHRRTQKDDLHLKRKGFGATTSGPLEVQACSMLREILQGTAVTIRLVLEGSRRISGRLALALLVFASGGRIAEARCQFECD